MKNVTVKLTQQEQRQILIKCKRNPKKFSQYVNRHTKSKTEIGDLKWHDTNGDEKVAESDGDKCKKTVNQANGALHIENCKHRLSINVLLSNSTFL